MYKVPVTTITAINKHPNADNLDIATVYGFNIIIRKGSFTVGDKALYIPIDSILPPNVEEILFPPDAKVKLSKHRVRQIKLRGAVSQGMLIIPSVLGINNPVLEKDYAQELNIIKYDPSEVNEETKQVNKKIKFKSNKPNPCFIKYNGLTNIKWMPHFFKDEEPVVVQEKLHGSNFRAGIIPTNVNSLWKRIKKFFGFLPEYEFTYGSNNVDITSKGKNYKGFYGNDVYGKVAERLSIASKLQPNEIIFCELIGEGVQKNYHYGHKTEHHLVLFDVFKNGKYLTPEEVIDFGNERGFTVVPCLYFGPFSEDLLTLRTGPSLYYPEHKVREGIVIKSLRNYSTGNDKRALKVISEDYLSDVSNTDFH